MKRSYSSLADAANTTKDERYAGGSVGIWYARGVELLGRIVAASSQGRKGVDVIKLARTSLSYTHCHLGNIEAHDPQTAFQMMYAERWAPGNTASKWIDSLGVEHTSMMAGDVLDFRGELLLVELEGFSRIQTVYGWGETPAHLKTRMQLANEGLRPARGAKPVARIEWKRGEKWADLFPLYEAVPKRKATPAQEKAIAARQLKARTCPFCQTVFGYSLPRGWDEYDCPSCAFKEAVAQAQQILASNPLYLDFETTGLGGFAVELAIIDAEGKALFDERINPQIPIEEEATAVHGIRDDDVRTRPTFAEYHETIRKIIEGRVVVAYNAPFDRNVLSREVKRIGAGPIKAQWTCAMELLSVYRGRTNYYESLGGDHTARGDCLATMQLVRDIANAKE